MATTKSTGTKKQAKAKKPNWKRLKHADGSASDVPKLVESLLAFERRRGTQPYDDLVELFDGDGEWFSASGPTIQLLLEGFVEAQNNFLVLPLIAQLIGAGDARAWARPLAESCPAELEGIIIAHQETLWQAVGSPHPQIRSGATLVMALCPSLATEARPRLLKTLAEDESDSVRASAALALGRFAERDEAATQLLTTLLERETSTRVRGAGALARLRLQQDEPWEFATELEGWLVWDPSETGVEEELTWFGGANIPANLLPPYTFPAARPLIEWLRRLADPVPALERLIERFGNGTAPMVRRHITDVVRQVGGFWKVGGYYPQWYVGPFDELSSEQQHIARCLAGTRLFTTAGFGLPAAGELRKRWIGLAPPGPLDQVVTLSVGGSELTGPLWWLWKQALVEDESGTPVPDIIATHLEQAQRWEALVLMAAGSYGTPVAFDEASIADELAGSAGNTMVVASAAEWATALAIQITDSRAQHEYRGVGLALSALLLLPLTRNGVAIQPQWDSLIVFGTSALAHELFAALPFERREKLAWSLLHPTITPAVRSILPIVDLLPSERFTRLFVKLLPEAKPHERTELEQKLRAMGQAHPEVAKVLAELGVSLGSS